MFYPILRYNGPDDSDDSLLEEYTEREGKLPIYIAVSQNPLHWRIVWLRDSRDVRSQGYCDVEIMIPDTSTNGDYHFRFSIRPATSRSVTQWKLYLVGELNRESRESLPNLAEQLAQPAKVGDMKNNCVTCVQSILLLLCSDDRNKIEAGEALDKTVVESVLKNAWELSKSGLGMQHQQT